MYRLFDFQKQVVERALDHLMINKEFVFKSPTGSGKTFILANIISKLIESKEEELTFLFFAPSIGSLDKQGFNKFNQYKRSGNFSNFRTKHVSVMDTDIGTPNKIERNKKHFPFKEFEANIVYFFGWDKLAKKTNKFTKESENRTFFDALMKTLISKRKIVIIIDEEHRNSTNVGQTKKFFDKILSYSKDFSNSIPYTILTSATPQRELTKDEFGSELGNITYSQVVAEEVVKKGVIINNGVDYSSMMSERNILEEAIKKQAEVISKYRNKKLLNINTPLTLIQIPDNSSSSDINDEFILSNLRELGIPDRKIAIYLDNKKENGLGEKITKWDIVNDNSIEFVIFKQALAVGWDVPRANIWVKFRVNQDEDFEIQTLGRILRNPFLKYFNENLIDNGFVFTNDETITKEVKDWEQSKISETINIKSSKEIKLPTNHIDQFEVSEENISKIYFNFFDDNIISEIHEGATKYNGKSWEKEGDFSNAIFGILSTDNQDERSVTQTTLSMDENVSLREWNKRFVNSFNDFNVLRLFKMLIEEIEGVSVKKVMNFLVNSPKRKMIWDKEIKEKIFMSVSHSSSKKLLEYVSSDEISVPVDSIDLQKMTDQKYDKGNIYNVSLITNEKTTEFRSREERMFYNELIKVAEMSMIEWIYKNSTTKDSYYTKYVSKWGDVKKFFPDFIFGKDNKIYFVDTKAISETGQWRDEDSENKLNGMKETITDIDAKAGLAVIRDGKFLIYDGQNWSEFNEWIK